MPAGRPRKPTHLHIAQGTYREDRHGGTVIDPGGEPVAPDWMSEEMQAEWQRVTGHLSSMGMLSACDAGMLVMWCEAWDEFRSAWAEVQKDGMVAVSSSGAVYQHPMVGVKNRAAARLAQMAQHFGLSPLARTRVKAAQEDKEDPLDALLAKRNA